MGALKYYNPATGQWEYVARGVQGAQGTPGAGAPDATASSKGSIQLAGDISGTAAAPTVPALTTKAPLTSPQFTTGIGVNTGANSTIGVTVDPGTDAKKGIVVFAHSATQSGNLLEVQDSSFNPIFYVTADGRTRANKVSLNGSINGTTALVANATALGVLTLPNATDTLVGQNTSDTLSNKTIASPTITGHPTLPTPTVAGDIVPKSYADQMSWQQIVIEGLFPASSVGTWSVTSGTGWLRTGWYQSGNTTTTGATITYNVWLAPGTYTIISGLRTGAGMGIVVGSLDGTTFATVDCYSASNGPFNNTTTGIVVSTGGVHTLSYTCTTKNASSTGYDFGFFFACITRTA